SAPKPGKRADAVAALAGGQSEPDEGDAVAGFGGDDLTVLRFRFIEESEFPQLVRRGQCGEMILRIQRCGAAEELQRDRSPAPLASRALYATWDRALWASARRASRSRVARGTCRYAFARG